MAAARELKDRIAGVALRIQWADLAVDQFRSEHADELLRELEDTARETAADGIGRDSAKLRSEGRRRLGYFAENPLAF